MQHVPGNDITDLQHSIGIVSEVKGIDHLFAILKKSLALLDWQIFLQ